MKPDPQRVSLDGGPLRPCWPGYDLSSPTAHDPLRVRRRGGEPEDRPEQDDRIWELYTAVSPVQVTYQPMPPRSQNLHSGMRAHVSARPLAAPIAAHSNQYDGHTASHGSLSLITDLFASQGLFWCLKCPVPARFQHHPGCKDGEGGACAI
jgi:hypothetical protein